MIPFQLFMMVCLRFACVVLDKSAILCWAIDDIFDVYCVYRLGDILEQIRQRCAIMYNGMMSGLDDE